MTLAKAKTELAAATKRLPKSENILLKVIMFLLEKLDAESIKGIFPKPVRKAFIMVSAPKKPSFCEPVQRITRAVRLHKSTVSINTSSTAQYPIILGSEQSVEVCAKGDVPIPASFEKSPFLNPTDTAFDTEKPKIPPLMAFISKAELRISFNTFEILCEVRITKSEPII